MKTAKRAVVWKKLCLLVLPLAAMVFSFFACQTEESVRKSRIEQLEEGLYRAVYFRGQMPEKLKLLDRLQFFKVPGISLAVIDKDRIDWFKTYGYKDIIKYEKLTPATIFQVGELSQPVAAAIVLAEVAKGHLDLEEEVGSYYENLIFAGRKFRPQGRISFTLSQLTQYDNLSQEYKDKLKEEIEKLNLGISFSSFESSLIAKGYKYKNFLMAYKKWGNEAKAKAPTVNNNQTNSWDILI